MSSADEKNLSIVVGVSGGIAAYKACHLVRLFKEQGHDVKVVPTPNALKFVGAATFEALSGNPVSTEVFDAIDEVQHVKVGQEADAIVIAPATADLIARLAAGRADDLLTATVLVATCPVIVVPAMHTEMWLNPATVDNVATLRRRGFHVMEPAHGRLTGKDTGPGRLPEPNQIAAYATACIEGATFDSNWRGRTVVVTAGGTVEHIDPVRFISNSSSGRQGFALAEAAALRGAHVVLIAARTDELDVPVGDTTVVRVSSARQMYDAVMDHAPNADVIVMAAAVADYRPRNVASSKLKKELRDAGLESIELVENPDILATVVSQRAEGVPPAQTRIVGFAAETGTAEYSALELAQRKFERKGCDLLMANEVGVGKVFGSDRNGGWLLSRSGDGELIVESVPNASKLTVAGAILQAVDGLR